MNSILRTRAPRRTTALEKPPANAARLSGKLARWLGGGLSLVAVLVAAGTAIAWRCAEARYDAAPAMRMPLSALADASDYGQRRLLLIQRDATHYDFVLEPTSDHVARVVLSNVDISPLAPQVNATGYAAGAAPQLTFDVRDRRLQVSGGDGFEAAHLASVTIASTRSGASGWQVSLAAQGDGAFETYYRGQFDFPLGHFRTLFEQVTQLDYADYRQELEAQPPLVASGAGDALWR